MQQTEQQEKQQQKTPRFKFTKAGLDKIDGVIDFPNFVLNSFDSREKLLRKKHLQEIDEINRWARVVYFSKNNLPVDLSNPNYLKFRDRLIELAKERQQSQSPDDDGEFFDIPEQKTGSGFIACPNNIVNDVSRLAVPIGGKRAGNNSPEIRNEAADICQRLFQRGIMDAGIYRELIDELADGYYSD